MNQMKRIGLLTFISLLTNIAITQDLDSLGIDNNPILNIHESEFLLFGFHQQIYNYIYQQIGKTSWKYTGLELLFLGIFICGKSSIKRFDFS